MQEQLETGIFGKKSKKYGVTPSVALVNPKFPHNVGAAIRAASCFGAKQVWFSGDRIKFDEIPTRHCVNLAAAVYLVLYDRLIKENPDITIYDMINERRHIFAQDDDFHKDLGIGY